MNHASKIYWFHFVLRNAEFVNCKQFGVTIVCGYLHGNFSIILSENSHYKIKLLFYISPPFIYAEPICLHFYSVLLKKMKLSTYPNVTTLREKGHVLSSWS